MIINIVVNDNYNNDKLNELLLLNDNNINENILNFGVQTYINQKYIINDLKEQFYTDLENKIKQKDEIIKNLKNDKINDTFSLIEKGKKIVNEEYDKIIELHNKKNNELKEQNDLYFKQIDFLNKKIIEISKYNDENKYNNINQNIDTLNKKMSNYFEKIFKDNTAKGIFGEDFIQNYLADKFSNSQIINCTKETASGDILFIYDELKLLIESKNVQTLKKEDIDKFYRDIEVRSAKNDINSALLVSLHDTNLINGHRIFHFEIKNNIPIIMISNVFNNNEYIKMAIILINNLIKKNIIKNDNYENDEEKNNIIINTINTLFENTKKQITLLENDKILISKLQESYNKREAEILNTNKIFNELFNKIPNIWKINDNKDKEKEYEKMLNDILYKINNKYKEDPNFIISVKNIESLGISNNNIKKIGGIRKISSIINNITL